eukprot:1688542-Rhodomonas_salina.2
MMWLCHVAASQQPQNTASSHSLAVLPQPQCRVRAPLRSPRPVTAARPAGRGLTESGFGWRPAEVTWLVTAEVT